MHFVQVYSWFMATHKVSVAAGLAGYLLLIVEMSGLGVLLRPLLAPTNRACAALVRPVLRHPRAGRRGGRFGPDGAHVACAPCGVWRPTHPQMHFAAAL